MLQLKYSVASPHSFPRPLATISCMDNKKKPEVFPTTSPNILVGHFKGILYELISSDSLVLCFIVDTNSNLHRCWNFLPYFTSVLKHTHVTYSTATLSCDNKDQLIIGLLFLGLVIAHLISFPISNLFINELM